MDNAEKSEQFVKHLTESQNRLYGYVYSLLGDHSRTADVVQETNLVLWRKLNEFDPERPFLPWAFAIARFQVMAQLRDQKRDRFFLDENLAETLCSEAESQAAKVDALREALRPCLQLLPPNSRALVERRYLHGLSIDEVARAVERTSGAVKVALLRVRRQLADCVQKRMAEGA